MTQRDPTSTPRDPTRYAAVVPGPGADATNLLAAVHSEVTLLAVGAGDTTLIAAADAVVVAIAAAGGVDHHTRLAWHRAAMARRPRIAVLLGLDDPEADVVDALDAAVEALDDDAVVTALPLYADDATVGGVLDLVDLAVVDVSLGARTVRAPEPEHLSLAEHPREELVGSVLATAGDDRYEQYLSTGAVDSVALRGQLAAATAAGSLGPLLLVEPARGIGVRELGDLLDRAVPSLAERPLPAVRRPDGSPVEPLAGSEASPLVAELVAAEIARLWSGRLAVRDDVWVEPEGATRRVPELEVLGVDGWSTAAAGVAGDLVRLPGSALAAGSTLSRPGDELVVVPEEHDELVVVLQVPATADAAGAKLAERVRRAVRHDPTVLVEPALPGADLRLRCVGEGHAEALTARLASWVGVTVVPVAT